MCGGDVVVQVAFCLVEELLERLLVAPDGQLLRWVMHAAQVFEQRLGVAYKDLLGGRQMVELDKGHRPGSPRSRFRSATSGGSEGLRRRPGERGRRPVMSI